MSWKLKALAVGVLEKGIDIWRNFGRTYWQFLGQTGLLWQDWRKKLIAVYAGVGRA